MKQSSSQSNLTKILSISVVFIVIIVIYSLCALPLYSMQKKHQLLRFYQALQTIDLDSLNDEEEDIIKDLSPEGADIAITDSDWNIIYTSRHMDSQELIQHNIIDQQDHFMNSPVIHAKTFGKFQTLRLQASFEQNGQLYYLYARVYLRVTREIVEETTYYLFFCFLLLTLAYAIFTIRQSASEASLQETKDNHFQEVQRDFIANVSHELKTPLAVISSQLELLEQAGDQINRTYYYESIHEEIDKMSTMIGDLLDSATFEYRIENMEKSSVNLSEMMEYLLMRYDSLFKRNSLKIETSFAPDIYAWGNQTYLEQAINNYLMNAFQHTAPGKMIKVTLSAISSMARIEVYNDGEAIPKEQLESIWEGFYSSQKRNGQVRKKSGIHLKNAGLGLYMVKKIIQQHNGTSGVANQEHGVTFWIELPIFK